MQQWQETEIKSKIFNLAEAKLEPFWSKNQRSLESSGYLGSLPIRVTKIVYRLFNCHGQFMVVQSDFLSVGQFYKVGIFYYSLNEVK